MSSRSTFRTGISHLARERGRGDDAGVARFFQNGARIAAPSTTATTIPVSTSAFSMLFCFYCSFVQKYDRTKGWGVLERDSAEGEASPGNRLCAGRQRPEQQRGAVAPSCYDALRGIGLFTRERARRWQMATVGGLCVDAWRCGGMEKEPTPEVSSTERSQSWGV